MIKQVNMINRQLQSLYETGKNTDGAYPVKESQENKDNFNGVDEVFNEMTMNKLQSEIGKRVEMYNPKSLLDAYHLARCQETMNDIMRKNSSTSLFSSSKIDQSKSEKGDNVELEFLSDGKGNDDQSSCEEINKFRVKVLEVPCEEHVEGIGMNSKSDEVKCSKTQLKVSEMDDSGKCVGVLDGPYKENKERTSLSNLVPCSSKIIDVPKESKLDKSNVRIVIDKQEINTFNCDDELYKEEEKRVHKESGMDNALRFCEECSSIVITIVEFDEVTKQGLGDYKIAFEAKSNEKEECVKGLILRNVYAYKCWNVITTSVVNNSVFTCFFKKQKLTGPNFIDWYKQLRIVLLVEVKLNYLEHPILAAPIPAQAGQQIAPEALATHAAWVKGSKEIVGLMVITMDSEIQQNLENLGAYEMLQELKTLFAQQAEQELLQTMQEFHSCKQEEGHMRKPNNELHAMLKLYEQTLHKNNAPVLHAIRARKVQKRNKRLQKPQPKLAVRGQNQEKGKNKLAYAPKPKIPPPPKREDPVKDSICHQCDETCHWKRNYPQYLAELLKNKKLSQGASRPKGSRKLKPCALSLYVSNGQRAVIEAIGSYHLSLPSGLVIVLNNCHYAPSITRGIILVLHLYDDGYVNRIVDNSIQVSRNNMVYFSVVPRDGIFVIDLSDSYTNVSSMYALSNKRSKSNLDYALLWHYCLGHISKKRIEKLQHDRLFNSTNLMAFEKCVPCMSASGSLEDLEIIQEEHPYPSIDTSLHHEEDDLEIDEPQSDIIPIRRSTRTRHAPDHIRAIRILIAIVTFYDYKIWQMDVKTAFLNRYLSEEVYMEQPEGFVNPKYPNRNLGDLHWTTIKKTLKYLRNTKDMFLVYRDQICVVLNRGDVDWKSAKQSIFATSSAEAKYIVAYDASKKAVWVRKFISELGVVPIIEDPINMYCDNTGAITIANESGITKGARHFCAKVHYLREVIEYGDVKLEKVYTDDNLAYPFTKALAFSMHLEHTKNIGMLPASSIISIPEGVVLQFTGCQGDTGTIEGQGSILGNKFHQGKKVCHTNSSRNVRTYVNLCKLKGLVMGKGSIRKDIGIIDNIQQCTNVIICLEKEITSKKNQMVYNFLFEFASGVNLADKESMLEFNNLLTINYHEYTAGMNIAWFI
nr:hypothetical protein [Tanacetum cinerariifolium]